MTSIGIGFLLRGRLYGNNSIVTISDIGVDSRSLLCLTNNIECCRQSDGFFGVGNLGEWYFPNNGSAVRVNGAGGNMYKNRGPSVVRLHRRNSAMMPTGVFHCEIPDANGIFKNVYIGVYLQGGGEFRTMYVPYTCSSYLHRLSFDRVSVSKQQNHYDSHLHFYWWSPYHCHLEEE